jgi:hypothetical protein
MLAGGKHGALDYFLPSLSLLPIIYSEQKRGSSGKCVGGLKKIFQKSPMHEIGNPLFSNPVKESMFRIRVRPMLIGRQEGALPLFDNSITLIWQGTGCRENWDWVLNSR